MEIFGVSRQIAQRDMGEYMNLAPGNLSYHKSDRAYLVTSIFKPMITQGTIDEFLALKSEDTRFGGAGHIVYVQQPSFHIDPAIFRVVLQGIFQSKQLKLRYQSLNNPKGLEREICPLKLVYTGFRWHIRAFCLVRNDYRDFSLARIISVPEPVGDFDFEACCANDKLWNDFVTLDFAINPKLSSDEASLLRQEFGFKNNILSIKTRKALINYTLQAYQVMVDEGQSVPRRDRLVLNNIEAISRFIW
jgi:hypothetical protein